MKILVTGTEGVHRFVAGPLLMEHGHEVIVDTASTKLVGYTTVLS